MVVFTTVVFVLRIAEICMVLLHMVLHELIQLRMGQQLQSLSFLHQLLFKKVVLKTFCDFVYYFRVKMSGSLFPISLWKQLFPQILWGQTTFYNSAPYNGRLHYSRLCFAHCRDMHGIALYGAPHVFDTTAQAPISSLAVAHKRLVILTY